ncbi:MAG TPA: hypothetical protein VFQ30_01875 [Ktedonobacteraceae bacterium]|nr:hypothetical protein [Ktedonobacteraceae bacterium]
MATDPLSLVFIGCFLFGLLFMLATILLGNIGHAGHAHVGHAGHIGAVEHVGHVAHGHAIPTHTGSHAVSTHTTGHAPAQANGGAKADNTPQGNQGGISSLFAYINPTSIVFFLLGFGFFGYVFHNTAHFLLPIALILAGVSGLVIAGLLLLLLSRLFEDDGTVVEQDVSDRTGLLGKVSITIQEHGIGEIIYVSPAGMRQSIPARSADGRRLERGQEVVVVNFQQGVAEVDTWDRFINEDDGESEAHMEAEAPAGKSIQPPASDELAKLRALFDELDKKTDTELVPRTDMQKE